MTKNEALELAREYAELHEVADHKLENGSSWSATCLREEAGKIEDRLKEHGFDSGELLRGLLANQRLSIEPKPDDGA